MKRLIIDRFEGDWAVCEQEDRVMINIERKRLPPRAVEGCCLLVQENGEILIDHEETKCRKDRISKMMENLFR